MILTELELRLTYYLILFCWPSAEEIDVIGNGPPRDATLLGQQGKSDYHPDIIIIPHNSLHPDWLRQANFPACHWNLGVAAFDNCRWPSLCSSMQHFR